MKYHSLVGNGLTGQVINITNYASLYQRWVPPRNIPSHVLHRSSHVILQLHFPIALHRA